MTELNLTPGHVKALVDSGCTLAPELIASMLAAQQALGYRSGQAAAAAPLTDGEKYTICRVAFEVYGPIGYAVGQHSSSLTNEIERVYIDRATPPERPPNKES